MRTVPFQHSWPFNCWCCIVGDRVIGPYFLEGSLTGQVYVNFLQNVLPQLMQDVPLHVRMNMWTQHAVRPLHYALCSRQVMLAEVRRSFHQRLNKCYFHTLRD